MATTIPITQNGSRPARTDTGARNFLRLKKEYGIFQGNELGTIVRGLPSCAKHIVEGLIPPRSVNILVGDSGIGKSPLGYQLGLAVASGTPFLDLPVQQGKVLLVDFENSVADAHWIMEQQRKHLGIDRFPPTFQLWPLQLDPLRETVEEVIAMFAPDLVILDSLRSFSPKMESDNSAAVEQIKRLRATAAVHGTAFLLIHHVRKQRQLGHAGSPVSLEEGEVMDWLLRAAGVRALINQTDVRLAVSRRADGTLVLRGHFRTRGEVGPFLLRRKFEDATGEPLAYDRFAAEPGMLQNPEQESCLAGLPDLFSFTEARLRYGKLHEATNLMIHKMLRLGLICKTARGQYRKAGCAAESTFSQELPRIQ
jgi:hypothetical protein